MFSPVVDLNVVETTEAYHQDGSASVVGIIEGEWDWRYSTAVGGSRIEPLRGRRRKTLKLENYLG